MLGRKASCEGVRTDLSASLALSRHRDIGPARFFASEGSSSLKSWHFVNGKRPLRDFVRDQCAPLGRSDGIIPKPETSNRSVPKDGAQTAVTIARSGHC